MDTKSNMGYMITLLVISIIMLIGGAYAYFTAGMSSGETEATLKVGAGENICAESGLQELVCDDSFLWL